MIIYPYKKGWGWENMGDDLSLLENCQEGEIIFRHYGWNEPSVTFGYSQRYHEVLERTGGTYTLFRRPTGGGIVYHGEDWTYTLIIPAGHPLHRERASAVYRRVHEAFLLLLKGQGVQMLISPIGDAPGECFKRGEVYDLVDASGRKIAGAAQKRNQHGMLIQGSISRDVMRYADLMAVGAALGAVLGGSCIQEKEWNSDNFHHHSLMQSDSWIRLR